MEAGGELAQRERWSPGSSLGVLRSPLVSGSFGSMRETTSRKLAGRVAPLMRLIQISLLLFVD